MSDNNVFYSKAGDAIEIRWDNCEYYGEYINANVVIYRAIEDGEVVGAFIENITRLINDKKYQQISFPFVSYSSNLDILEAWWYDCDEYEVREVFDNVTVQIHSTYGIIGLVIRNVQTLINDDSKEVG